MAYDDDGSLTFLPYAHTVVGSGNVAVFAIDSIVGDKMNRRFEALASGILHSVFLHIQVAIASNTQLSRWAVLVNNVKVATFEVPTALTAGTVRHIRLTPVAGKAMTFDEGDAIEIALDRVGTDSVLLGGAIGVRLAVALHGST